MKKLVVLTATRAEYGLLSPIIKKLRANNKINVEVAVTGMHLSPEFGMTVNEIERDGTRIDKKVEILMSSDTSVAVSKAMGLALFSFSEYFEESKPDALMVLGDRYETLAVCCAAMNARIPIFHLYGGEATEGLIDEAVRNSITKMSYIHFASTEVYRKRIIQMGENPERVFYVGAMGVENALRTPLISQQELEVFLHKSLGRKYAVLTYHPVTLENHTAGRQVDELLKAIEKYPDIMFLCTKANADAEGRIINQKIEQYILEQGNACLVDSLGSLRYLSAVRHACFVIGNSSSGLVEVPSFNIPTINIGDRQKGRIQGETIINCEPTELSICEAIERALDKEFIAEISESINPYEKSNTSEEICNITEKYLLEDKMNIKKKFYDLK